MARPAGSRIGWVVELPGSGKRFSHTTFNGLLLDNDALNRSHPIASPHSTTAARRARSSCRTATATHRQPRSGAGAARPSRPVPVRAGDAAICSRTCSPGTPASDSTISTMPARPQAATRSVEPFHRYTFDDGTVWTEFYHAERRLPAAFPRSRGLRGVGRRHEGHRPTRSG